MGGGGVRQSQQWLPTRTSGQLPGLESGVSTLLWRDRADGLPACWDEGVEGCGVIFLIAKVTVFCMVHLATNCIGFLTVSSIVAAKSYLTP